MLISEHHLLRLRLLELRAPRQIMPLISGWRAGVGKAGSDNPAAEIRNWKHLSPRRGICIVRLCQAPWRPRSAEDTGDTRLGCQAAQALTLPLAPPVTLSKQGSPCGPPSPHLLKAGSGQGVQSVFLGTVGFPGMASGRKGSGALALTPSGHQARPPFVCVRR